MGHTIEPATSGRAQCRGCGKKIAKGELRFGERLPNPFAEGEMTLWFHVPCGALKRPEPLLEALGETTRDVERREWLIDQAQRGIEHRRLPRVDGAQRDPSGRASCRACREKIEKGAWRIRLVFYEEGRFEPSGFVHASCAKRYFETDDDFGADVLQRARHFSELTDEDVADLGEEIARADA